MKIEQGSEALPLLDEQDFETTSDLGRLIWTAGQLRSFSAGSSIPWFQGFSLIGRANYTFPKHVVPLETFAHHYEIIFVEKGSQVHWINQRSFPLHPGDCLLIPPQVQHSTKHMPEGRGRFYWWIFDPQAGLLQLGPERSRLLMQNLLRRFHCYPSAYQSGQQNIKQSTTSRAQDFTLHLSSQSSKQLKLQLNTLFQSFQAAQGLQNFQKGQSLHQQKLLEWEHLLTGLFFTLSAEAESSYHIHTQHMEAVCDYILNHLKQTIELEELIALTPYSESHFQRIFRNELGLPPRDYINRKKVQLAQELLSQGEKVIDVAAELGFSSSQYFAVVFQRYAGMSPSRWCRKDLPK